ncbi:hypothetical protein V6N11_007972 [Hibiscus sabdariffa]|uniref:Reverse transcriptase zinc-binding domain-containing protein n=1 Tax=Hibiscus sabdariffa TaxID=183260 RepID=A0ABR2PZW2_9ROSI
MDMVSTSGDWRWAEFESLFPVSVLLHIATTKVPCLGGAIDFCVWKPPGNHLFLVRSAYQVCRPMASAPVEEVWTAVGWFQGWSKVKMFLWLVCHQRLMTNSERVRRHLAHDSSCSIYGAVEEDVDNILRQCPLVEPVWVILVKCDRLFEFRQCTVKEWVRINLTKPEYFAAASEEWDLLFAVVAWNIWMQRNRLVFNLEPCDR